METYKIKLRHILPTFLGISILSILLISLFRWLFTMQFEVLPIKEEVFEIWIPLIFPWIPMLILLRPKLRILKFKKDNDKGRLFFQFIAWFTMGISLLISQQYLTTAAGTLTEIPNINSFEKSNPTRYYRIKKFDVSPKFGGAYTEFRATGKHNERLNFETYFVYPLIYNGQEKIDKNYTFWYGIKFRDDISNRISDAEKEQKYKAFWEKSAKEFENTNFQDVSYFVRIPYSSDKEGFSKAVENRFQGSHSKDNVIFIPQHNDFNSRNGNRFPWIFGSLAIGYAIFSLTLLFPAFDKKEYKNYLSGKKPKEDDLKDALMYLVPKGSHFATSIILDINILVFLIMIFSGVHLLYPNGAELIAWGANRRAETMSGEWWRLLTSTFVHAGIMHLILNIAGFVIAAIFVEPHFGRVKYSILYLLSGIAGSIASIIWHENTVSIGASGAIFGLYGAILGLLLTNAFPKEAKRGIFIFIGIYVALNLVFGLTGGIDNAAHIGGLISGAVLALILFAFDKKSNNNS